MKIIFTILIVLVSVVLSCSFNTSTLPLEAVYNIDTTTSVQTIAFGSCNKQYKPQTIWTQILKNKPDLWIWLGDNIYADTEDMVEMENMYDQQKKEHSYQNFTQSCPIIGIWDDHDYGINDGGKDFKHKSASKNLMLDFLNVPKNAAVRSYEGTYQTYIFGEGKNKIKTILLDTRYFRDTLLLNGKNGNRYKINAEGDILGEAQWAWLEKELAKNEAAIHLIASSIQIIATEQKFEKWSNFPKARKQLLDLLSKHHPNQAILLSGDRHISEVAKMNLPNLAYPLYEITSSGLTHAYTKNMNEPNQYRVGKIINQRNFSVLNINWTAQPVELQVEIRGAENQLLQEITLE